MRHWEFSELLLNSVVAEKKVDIILTAHGRVSRVLNINSVPTGKEKMLLI